MPVGLPSLLTESHIPHMIPVLSNLFGHVDENTGQWRKCTVQEFISMLLPYIGESASAYMEVNNAGDENVDVEGLGSVRLNFLNPVDEQIAVEFSDDDNLYEIKMTFYTGDVSVSGCSIELPANFLAADYRWDIEYHIFTPDAIGIYEITCLKRGDYWNVYFSPQPIALP